MAQLKDLIVNGPSRFIGNVYATTFTGDLNGNANTATSATTAAALTGKTLVTASAVTTSNWPTYKDNHIPTMSFITYWNGAYSGTSSNLTYCAQGTIIGSNNIGNQSVKYATTSGSCNGNAATAGSATNADKLDGYHASSFSLTSHTHSYIVTQGDTRGVATKPNDYSNRITFAGLKSNSTIGSPSSTTYSYVVGLRGWSDTSGGKAHELAFSDNGIFHRIGATDTWETWAMMLTTANYNSYAPSLTGSGASGTWGISITGNAATATKVGTSTVGSATMPVYIKSGTPTAITSFPEANLSWGGKNFSASYGPIDAAMIPDLGACRSMFAKAAGITVQYSRDGGSTWVDYGLTDAQKTALFSVGYPVKIGGPDTTTGIDKSTYLVRVILETKTANIYTQLNKFAIYIGTSGTEGNYCTIEARLRKNLDDGVDTWVNFADKIPINGWTGWNIINTPTITTYGNNPPIQYGEIRFTFGVTSHPRIDLPGLYIEKIYCFGGMGWVTPSNMAKNGYLYSFDTSQNATFPGAITSTKFVKSGGTSAQFLKADGSADSNTYSKSSHTHTSVLDVNGSSAITFAYSKAGLSYGDYTWLAGWNGSELRAINKSQFAQASHTHTKSQITDFPTSLPASDVYSWAKASTKPTYNATEVKLSNYSKDSSYSAISASDTVQKAIGKLEGALSGLENLLASI